MPHTNLRPSLQQLCWCHLCYSIRVVFSSTVPPPIRVCVSAFRLAFIYISLVYQAGEKGRRWVLSASALIGSLSLAARSSTPLLHSQHELGQRRYEAMSDPTQAHAATLTRLRRHAHE